MSGKGSFRWIGMMLMCFGQFNVSLAQADLNSGLAIHLRFLGDLTDYSGNAHNATGKNYSFDEDCARSPRSSVYLNGSNSYIQVPASDALNRTEKITIAFWVFAESANPDQPIVFRGKADGATKRLAYSVGLTSTGQLAFQTVTPPSCNSFDAAAIEPGPLPLKQWHSVVATFDGVQLSLYRNGNLVAQEQVGFSRLSFCDADMPLLVGASSISDASTFNGRVTDLRIYDRVITADEINQLSVSCQAAPGCMPPPTLDISVSTPTSLLVKWTNTRDMNNLVRYDAEYKDSASRDWLFAFQSTPPSTSDSITGLVPGRTYDVRIRSNCVSLFGGWIYKQFTVPFENKCQPPFNLTVADVSETEARLQWDVQPTGIGVNVQYIVKGVSNSWVDAAAEVTDKTYTITGLTPGTDYEWRIQTACPDGPSEWVISEFTTQGIAPCRAPFNLLPADISGNRAALQWEAWDGSKYYEVEYRQTGTTAWIRATPALFSFEIEYIDSLQPLTPYQWRVRAVCESGVSEWSNAEFITTSGQPIDLGVKLLADFTFTPAACKPGEIRFSNTSIVTRTNISTLLWEFGDGQTSTNPDPVHVFNKPGTYDVTLTIGDDNGRTNAKKQTVQIKSLALEFAEAGKDVIVCSKEPIQLRGSGGVKYEWQPCGGLSDCDTAEPLVTPGIHDRYVLRVTDANGCVDTSSIAVRYLDPAKDLYIPNAFTPNNDGLNDVFRPLANADFGNDAELKIFDKWGNNIMSTANRNTGWDGTAKGKPQPAGVYPYMIRVKGQGACANQTIKGTITLLR